MDKSIPPLSRKQGTFGLFLTLRAPPPATVASKVLIALERASDYPPSPTGGVLGNHTNPRRWGTGGWEWDQVQSLKLSIRPATHTIRGVEVFPPVQVWLRSRTSYSRTIVLHKYVRLYSSGQVSSQRHPFALSLENTSRITRPSEDFTLSGEASFSPLIFKMYNEDRAKFECYKIRYIITE